MRPNDAEKYRYRVIRRTLFPAVTVVPPGLPILSPPEASRVPDPPGYLSGLDECNTSRGLTPYAEAGIDLTLIDLIREDAERRTAAMPFSIRSPAEPDIATLTQDAARMMVSVNRPRRAAIQRTTRSKWLVTISWRRIIRFLLSTILLVV
jgi:hypothetical protein